MAATPTTLDNFTPRITAWDLTTLSNVSTTPNTTTAESCVSWVDLNRYFMFNLIPAVCIIALFSSLQRRKALCTGCLNGRPAVLSPLDFIQGHSKRFSYAAAFGLTTGLCLQMILLRELVVPPSLETPSYLITFYYVLTVIIYGTNFYPVFAALFLDSIISYSVGTVYVWIYSTIYLLSLYNLCTDSSLAMWETLGQLPIILCCVYLMIGFPFRLIISIRDRNKDKSIAWREHYQAKYVTSMFAPAKTEIVPVTIKEKILDFLRSKMYKSVSGYRYSTRVVSTTAVTLIMLYMIFITWMGVYEKLVVLVADAIIPLIEALGASPIVKLVVDVIMEKTVDENTFLYILHLYVTNIKVSFVLSTTLAFLLVVYNILRSMACYRNDQLLLYKGNHPNLPPLKDLGCSTMMTGFIRFAGFQVAYCAWSFIMIMLVLFLVTFLLGAVIIIPLTLGYGKWFLVVLNGLWPVILITLVLMVGQILLSRFAFLQERGAFLAVNNRRWLFLFTYYMFFYNIFLGLFSALKRIIFSIVFGAIFLGRLDISSLSRYFEQKDPGYACYLGLLYVEHCHNHPILVTFCNILIDDHNRKHRLGRYKSGAVRDEENAKINGHCGKYREFKDDKSRRSFKRAQMRWQL
ncbi:unnamed protein product, partial [Owenia fusiformis]